MTTVLKTLPIMKFHRDGTKPEHGEVFVFGSNLAGDFSEGQAKRALSYGASNDVVAGVSGKSYGIPIRDKKMHALSRRELAVCVVEFLEYARSRFRQDQFFITRIGGFETIMPSPGRPDVERIMFDGIDNMTEGEIATLFIGAPVNCSFPESWRRYLA